MGDMAPLRRPLIAQLVRRDGWPALAADSALCAELKQRCAVCYQWIASSDGKGIKLHLRRAHQAELKQCEPDIHAQLKLFKSSAISPCAVCGVKTADAKQHGGQCPVLFQILLVTRLLAGHCRARGGSETAAGGSQATQPS